MSGSATTMCGLPTSIPSPGRGDAEAAGAHEDVVVLDAPGAEVDLEPEVAAGDAS